MKRQLHNRAVFLAALGWLNLGGLVQPATAAGEAKGFRGYLCNDTGKPAPNAKVTVNGHRVEVDPQGRFFVPHEKLKYDRTVHVTAEATFENAERNPPYRWEVNYSGLFDYATGEESVTIRPRIPGVLGGRVLSADGKPLAGATVSADINVGLLVCTGHMRVREPVQTDAEGRFRIPKLYANNDYMLRIEAAGYERKWTGWIHVRTGEPEPVEIRLREAPAFVAGKVVDEQGNPVAKTRVVLGHGCCPDATTETDAEGDFRIENLLVGQPVALWANGTTVKTNAGASNVRIVIRPKP
jgi:hypothetical protein